MKSKLLTLALAVSAIMAVAVGGAAAVDTASPDTVQTDDHPDDRDRTDDEQADEEPTKISVSESTTIDLDENQTKSFGDGMFGISLDGDFSGLSMVTETSADEPAADTDYDAKITADKVVTFDEPMDPVFYSGEGIFTFESS